jgi:hypothetical protein
MKRAPCVVVALLLLLSNDVQRASLAAPPEDAVAIVCLLSGDVFETLDDKRTQLRLFQRLKPGTVVETESAARLVLTFSSGARYELGEKASATVGRTALESRKGTVKTLPSVPPAIDIAPIAKEEKQGTRLAAARIRTADASGRSISNLYPSNNAATLAQSASLRFDPVAGYQKYRVEVEDETGNAVFSVETASATVQVSPGVLRPGANYYFRVRTLDAEKPALRGEAVFSTLSEDNAKKRAALKVLVDDTSDPSLLGLLAEFDRSVGLQREACEELNAALDQSPGNRPIADALARFGCLKPDRSGG